MYVLYVWHVCVYICLYLNFGFATYIHIHTIHAHTDICILVFTYALYVCVHMFTSNMGNITCQLQYIHICTGRITDDRRQTHFLRVDKGAAKSLKSAEKNEMCDPTLS